MVIDSTSFAAIAANVDLGRVGWTVAQKSTAHFRLWARRWACMQRDRHSSRNGA